MFLHAFGLTMYGCENASARDDRCSTRVPYRTNMCEDPMQIFIALNLLTIVIGMHASIEKGRILDFSRRNFFRANISMEFEKDAD